MIRKDLNNVSISKPSLQIMWTGLCCVYNLRDEAAKFRKRWCDEQDRTFQNELVSALLGTPAGTGTMIAQALEVV